MAFKTEDKDEQFDGQPIQAATTVSTGPRIFMDKYFFNSNSQVYDTMATMILNQSPRPAKLCTTPFDCFNAQI